MEEVDSDQAIIFAASYCAALDSKPRV
jgi:hypothetical protein